MNPDTINALFEAVGAVLSWINFRKLLADREVKGIHWPITGFWAAWGLWNLYYYPALEQWFSFAAGVFLVSGNLAWVAAVLWLKWHNRPVALVDVARGEALTLIAVKFGLQRRPRERDRALRARLLERMRRVP